MLTSFETSFRKKLFVVDLFYLLFIYILFGVDITYTGTLAEDTEKRCIVFEQDIGPGEALEEIVGAGVRREQDRVGGKSLCGGNDMRMIFVH